MTMKTAISIPDDVFEEAEITAKQLGLARSQLYVRAIKEYIEKHDKNKITEKLNKIYYADHSTKEQIEKAGLESLRESTRHDSW
jgi:metal-responsive CopG/Arc/MetJ family transcriptional regulator